MAERAQSRGRVLLVEDDEMLRRLYPKILRSAGFTVEAAGDADTALKLLGQGPFDMVLSDIGLPGMTGLELLRAIRQRDLDLPVVLVTAGPTVESAVEALESGALRYLIKPVESGVLESTAEKAVQLHRLARLKRESLDLLGQGRFLVGDRAGLEATFDSALVSLWMAFQPIVCLSRKEVFGYEALVRTTSTALPSPLELIEAAEQLGRLWELGSQIRRCVAATAEPRPGLCVFVNLHPQDLVDPTLYDSAEPLAASARHVILEITERASLYDVHDVRARTTELRALGFRLAVDDLGAGYAGLASFAQLEPEFVKLDMSLVRDVDREKTKRRLIRAMVEVCKDLGIVVIAEGVERAEERDVLIELGCDLLQGYFFGRPNRELLAPTFGD